MKYPYELIEGGSPEVFTHAVYRFDNGAELTIEYGNASSYRLKRDQIKYARIVSPQGDDLIVPRNVRKHPGSIAKWYFEPNAQP